MHVVMSCLVLVKLISLQHLKRLSSESAQTSVQSKELVRFVEGHRDLA